MTPLSQMYVLIYSLFISVAVLTTSLGQAAEDRIIYDDILAAGWDNWSWGSTIDLASTSETQYGSQAISVTYTEAWAAMYLHQGSPIDLSNYSQLSFWIHGGTTDNQLRVVVNDDSATSYSLTAEANTWKQVRIPFSSFSSPASLSDIYWQENSATDQNTFYLDEISLIATDGPPPLALTLSVDAASDRQPISEDIYGMNFATESLAVELRLPVRRWGGNATTRYNWRNDTSNKGSDWYFENIAESNDNPAALPSGSSADRFIEQDRRTGSRTIMTVPLIGWVAGERRENHPYDCGFKVSKYGAQQAVDPWDSDCGNGVYPDGSNITGNTPSDTSIATTSSFIASWIQHLVDTFGTAEDGGVAYYNLDNEPMLWNSTHRDVYPQSTSYDDLRDRSYQYAAAIKSVDPTAGTLGPVVWGWCAYFYSAADNCSPSGSDYLAHNSTPFVPWYLQQMHDYELQHGTRILDYVDLHIYPQVDGVFSSAAGSPTVQAARLRSTRQLWDPSYIHEGWIAAPVFLIPRMQQWVNDNYPGTKTAITEYNWGGLGFINGALAQADILGIFGREGLDLATLWDPPTSTQPGAFAFRLYRNYDGNGSGFGEIGVQGTSSSQDKLAIYAAERSADHALTIMVINKRSINQTSHINLKGYTPTSTAAAYRYSEANLNSIEELPVFSVNSSGFDASFPENSITLFILSQEETLLGDIDGSGEVDLQDTILILQLMSGFIDVPIVPIEPAVDINSDGQVGMAEALYTLQKLAGFLP